MTRWWHLGTLLLGLAVAGAADSAPRDADHAPWDRLLHRYVHAGLVDYHGLATERAVLDQYLASLQDVDPATWPSRQAQAAFWINAYNACVIAGVLDHQPLASVKDVKGFFDKVRYPIGSHPLTLNEIEAKGRALGDWRIHVAVVCASSSCPPLRSEAYVAERLEDQLTEQATRFFRDQRHGLRIEGSTLWLSKIVKWYAEDFVGKQPLTSATVLSVLGPFLAPEVRQRLQQERLAIKFLDYDWTLNAQRPGR